MAAEKSTRPLLMIPGPTEYDEEVLSAMSTIGTSHVDPGFIESMGRSLENVRKVFLASDGQPFILAASGSLGWDLIAANTMDKGDAALVINTGYFGDSFGDVLEGYGSQVDHLRAKIGGAPTCEELEQALKKQKYKLVTITHVDTSTGVLAPVKAYAQTIRQILPDVLIAVDGVCSVAGEELRMTEWDIDFAFTGSQKALSVPPGLSVSVARPRALAIAENRKSLVPNYYCRWSRWIPIMKAYEARGKSYFATPAVQLIFALDVALQKILADGGIEKRFEEHTNVSNAFKRGLAALGIKLVPEENLAAHTLTAAYYPEGIVPADFLGGVKANGAIIAGGLHKEIKTKYFRVGHMGTPSSRSVEHVRTVIRAIEASLISCGHTFERGAGLAAL